MMAGKFITLEGIDGAGKSTHLAWLERFITQRGLHVVVTREPGGTPLGEQLRRLLLEHAMDPETEALLMFAARREHLERVIRPALSSGAWVISDRFSDASFAYQGGGRGVEWEKLQVLERWVQHGLQPDLTLLFDVPAKLAKERLAGVRDPDRFEQEQADFFERVRAGYLRRMEQFPQRIHLVDSTLSVGTIQKSLEKVVLSICS